MKKKRRTEKKRKKEKDKGREKQVSFVDSVCIDIDYGKM